MLFGYARVSTADQILDRQIDMLVENGVDKHNIHTDVASGAKSDREGLAEVLKMMRSGDKLVVTRLDRLGRSVRDLINIVEGLKDEGIQFRSINESIDTDDTCGTMIFHIFCSIAEFERNLISERTKAGLKAARARGRKGGRPKKLSSKDVELMKKLYQDKTIPAKDIAERFCVSRATLYKWVG